MPVDEAYISQYGVIVPSADGGGVAGLVEKPKQDEAPSNLASIGRYVLTTDIFDLLRNLRAGSGGEIQLTDALNLQAQDGLVEAIKLKAKRFDCGSIDGFMSASAHEYAKRLEN
jgi:UTP--glucose-1-phosphate uridylyltransferase